MKQSSGYLRCWPRHLQKWSLLSRLKQSCANDPLSSQDCPSSGSGSPGNLPCLPGPLEGWLSSHKKGALRLCFLTFWFYCRSYFVSYLFFQKLHPPCFQFHWHSTPTALPLWETILGSETTFHFSDSSVDPGCETWWILSLFSHYLAWLSRVVIFFKWSSVDT